MVFGDDTKAHILINSEWSILLPFHLQVSSVIRVPCKLQKPKMFP